MAAPTIRQIREGAATNLRAIDGLRVHDHVPGQFSPPAAVVGMPSRPPTETFQRGTDLYQLTVWVVVARQADRQSEKVVEGFLNPTGSTSVRAAMYADKTLGGFVNDVFEESAEPTEFVFGSDAQQTHYVGLEFTYRILAAGRD